MQPSLLLVGLEPALRDLIRRSFYDERFVFAAEDAQEALAALKKHSPSFCLLEIRQPQSAGLDLLKQIKRFDESIEVVAVMERRDVESALDAMKLGAYDILTSPVSSEEIKAIFAHLQERRRLLRENRILKEAACPDDENGFLGKSRAALQINRRITELAAREEPALIWGEPGTEKERVAREIHLKSSRASQPFVIYRCCDQNRHQAEAELFGQKADPQRSRGISHVGKLEFAEEGSLYLEQVERLPREVQARLLRLFKQEGAGESPTLRLLASATSPETRGANSWNEEWRQYLNRHSVTVPPLRERQKDIPHFLERIMKRICAASRVPVKGFTRDAERFLMNYAWPGNLKELENTIETMVFSTEKEMLGLEDLPLDILVKQMDQARTPGEARLTLKKARRHFERQYIRRVLEKTKGNQTRAAQTLGLHRNTLIWKLRELQMIEEYRLIVSKRRAKKSRKKSLPSQK